jgi:hypothetical protein
MLQDSVPLHTQPVESRELRSHGESDGALQLENYFAYSPANERRIAHPVWGKLVTTSLNQDVFGSTTMCSKDGTNVEGSRLFFLQSATTVPGVTGNQPLFSSRALKWIPEGGRVAVGLLDLDFSRGRLAELDNQRGGTRRGKRILSRYIDAQETRHAEDLGERNTRGPIRAADRSPEILRTFHSAY